MTATKDELLARLDTLGIDAVTHAHPPVFTVEESRDLRGSLPGAHCKNLFMKDKKGVVWLLSCLEDRPVDMKRLKRQLGSGHLSFGKPDLLMECLGVEPGSVTPFGLINDTERRVRGALDKAMMAMDPVNFHPLINSATTALSPDGLLRFIESCGHRPQLVDLDHDPADDAACAGGG